ncbi:MAG: indolepyruvate ferredoxin oxidoreductase subunit alpha [Bacillota bacterium]|nr:indolepyruvate ferredoxin oxidoreductase subunit alpha [Bacillota bacterium]
MVKEYVMGNSAIALGAIAAGVRLAAGYPGTPSSEIIETMSGRSDGDIYLEWSVNEKAAMEVACAAAYSGARSMVTMKQMGLNVAADPFMSVAYVGVKGGMVVVAADDPGPISSQTEQDTRRFAEFARVPVFDPSSPEEAFEMIRDAFYYSEKYNTPVLFRPTTRVCHAYASINTEESFQIKEYEGFVKDSGRWVIFPGLANANHEMIEKRNVRIGKDFSSYRFNTVSGASRKAVIAGGVSCAYAGEFMRDYPELKLIRVGTPYPFPEDFMLKALEGVDEVLCFEELSPFLEENVLRLAGRHRLNIRVHGKLDNTTPLSGENSADIAAAVIGEFYGISTDGGRDLSDRPELPVRPPVLCAGCPHRAAFYAVKKAMEGRKTYFCGDIGCYTLGNAMPLDMVDTCLCMGAGVTMAQGFHRVDDEGTAFAFIGDSTFFASGITGAVNAVYNEADIILCVLDNSTTAMTGHQPHPGTGKNLMGDIAPKISIEKILEGIGLEKIITVDPFDFNRAKDAVSECAGEKGVRAIIFRAPCVAISKPAAKCEISRNCINCRKCIKETGCPALIVAEGQVAIDSNLCTGCGLCANICPAFAIGGAGNE